MNTGSESHYREQSLSIRIAHLVSRVFYPPIVGGAGFLIGIWGVTGSFVQAVRWIILCLAFVLIPPMATLVIGMKTGVIGDLDVSNREERIYLYIIGSISILLCLLLLMKLKAPRAVLAGLTTIFSGAFIGFIINLHWKISVHIAVISMLATIFVILFGKIAVPLIAIIPLVGWARYRLQQHSPAQIAAGAGLGCLTAIACYSLWNLV